VSVDRYLRYRDDPEAFFRDQLRMHLYSKQREIVQAVLEHDRVAVRACSASGKTAVAAGLMLWWLTGGPGSILVSTSVTERQVNPSRWLDRKRLLS
jgi:phage terminase large subunit